MGAGVPCDGISESQKRSNLILETPNPHHTQHTSQHRTTTDKSHSARQQIPRQPRRRRQPGSAGARALGASRLPSSADTNLCQDSSSPKAGRGWREGGSGGRESEGAREMERARDSLRTNSTAAWHRYPSGNTTTQLQEQTEATSHRTATYTRHICTAITPQIGPRTRRRCAPSAALISSSRPRSRPSTARRAHLSDLMVLEKLLERGVIEGQRWEVLAHLCAGPLLAHGCFFGARSARRHTTWGHLKPACVCACVCLRAYV